MTMTCDDARDLAAAFVLGVLSLEVASAVREHLATCDEAHPEFAELGGVVPYLADSLDPVEPPAGLRARILAAAAADTAGRGAPSQAQAAPPSRAGERSASAPAEPIAFPIPRKDTGRVTARTEGRNPWLLRIAAVLAIAALGAWNVQLQSRLSDVQGDLAAAQAYRAAVTAVLDVASQPGAQSGFLAAGDPASNATGIVATAGNSIVLAVQNLTPTSGTQVYEAWVIVGEAAPVPLGGFEVGAGGTGAFRGSTDLAVSGAIVALTLEPASGATTPTLPVLTLGTITGVAG